MTKKDLKTGDLVRTRNGNIYLIVRNCDTKMYGLQDFTLISYKNGFMNADSYSDDLTTSWSSFDIMEVRGEGTVNGGTIANLIDGRFHSLPCIWKREEVITMTISEIEKKLGIKNLKIVKEK